MSTSTGLKFRVFLCRQVLRLFSYVDRFKVLRFSMSIFALFPVYMSTGLCNYGVNVFLCRDIQSWCIFNPDVYFMTCKKIFDINHAFYSHILFLRVIFAGHMHKIKTSRKVIHQFLKMLASKTISLNFGVNIFLEIVQFPSFLATFLWCGNYRTIGWSKFGNCL